MRVGIIKSLTLINTCPSSESIVSDTWELHEVERAMANRAAEVYGVMECEKERRGGWRGGGAESVQSAGSAGKAQVRNMK